MAKSPKPKTQRSAQSTTNPTAKNKSKSAGAIPKPCNCCPDCVGKPSGTMGGCEDDGCRDIPPATAANGSLLYQHPNVNEAFQYWESLENLAELLAPLVMAAMARQGKGAPRQELFEPPEETPPHQTVK